jgi:small acid-soluble spore protein F (minor alpha/beta-type SASP)
MSTSKKGKKNKPMTPQDKLKYQIAHELGLYDKVSRYGWGALTAAETGRIGGIMTTRKKAGLVPEEQSNVARG